MIQESGDSSDCGIVRSLEISTFSEGLKGGGHYDVVVFKDVGNLLCLVYSILFIFVTKLS